MKRSAGMYEVIADEKNRVYVNANYNDEDLISRPHYHNAVELNIVIKGSIGCWVDGKKYTAKEGQMLYFNSMNVHFFDIKKDSEILFAVIDESMVKDFQKQYASETGKPTFPVLLDSVEKNAEIKALVQNWRERYKDYNILQNKGIVDYIFGSLAANYDVLYLKENKNKLFALDILRYLEEHFKERISLDVVATHFGYSKTSVSRIFHSVIGQDIRAYVNMLRAEHVHELLEQNSRITVLEAAFSSGFENTSSFYRAYNARFNELPKRK